MNNHKVLMPQVIQPEGLAYLKEHGYEYVIGRGVSEDEIIADIADCDALIVRTAKITRRIIESAPKLKVIARHGAGYDGVDIEAAKERGILVLTAGPANAVSVAEVAVFYMLYCARNFRAIQEHYVQDYKYAKTKIRKTELNGKTLGLIGVGNIGSLVAKKAALGFDMKVLAYDPFFKGTVPEYMQLVDDRDTVFKESDYVSLHVPALPSTIHSVGAREFSLMKPTAYLINTSRGTVVDEPALIEALKNHEIAGAGLDVLEKEPMDQDNPLLAMENVVTAPHIGGMTVEASARSSVACAEGIDDFFNGIRPKFVIPEMRNM